MMKKHGVSGGGDHYPQKRRCNHASGSVTYGSESGITGTAGKQENGG